MVLVGSFNIFVVSCLWGFDLKRLNSGLLYFCNNNLGVFYLLACFVMYENVNVT